MRPFRRMAMWYARWRYGGVLEPMQRWAEHGGVFWAWSAEEMLVETTWRTLPRRLRELAALKAAGSIGCPWCLDYGSYVGTSVGLREDQLRDLHRWQESTAYDEEERDILAYADALTVTPARVDDELTARLRDRYGEKGLIELTATIALENQRSRFNAGMGLVSQGWSKVCALPDQPAGATAATSGQPQLA